MNDGSTDGTGGIARAGTRRFTTGSSPGQHAGAPGPKLRRQGPCFNAGYERIKALDHEIIGNLDGDMSFEEDFLEFLATPLRRRSDDWAWPERSSSEDGGYSSDRQLRRRDHVSGQVPAVPARVLRGSIGGYVPHRAGGIDWIAVTTARMMGWRTRSFREKWFFHHRSLGTAERSRLASAFSYGEKDYYLGGHPVWELCRVAYRMSKPPYLVERPCRGVGYMWAAAATNPSARLGRADAVSPPGADRKVEDDTPVRVRLKGIDSSRSCRAHRDWE